MPVFMIIVSILLMALFVVVAIAGNRAQDRQNAEIARRRQERAERDETAGSHDEPE